MKLFILAILLPAVFVAAGGAWLVSETWRRLWDDEREALELRARIISDTLMNRAHEENIDGMRPPDKPPRRFGNGHPPPADRPPRHPHHRMHCLTQEQKSNLATICDEVRKNNAAMIGDVSFKIVDPDGIGIYAADDWPSKPGTEVEWHVGPPLGDGSLMVARADGGKSMRTRAAAVVAIGASIVLLLVATLVSGGLIFIRTLRRERRESRMKTDFIDNVSHELRTPLAGIRLNAELLAEGRIRDEDKRKGALESILTESDRLGRMVSELLDFGRLEKGTRRYSLETFDLAAFASGAAEAQGVASISNGRAHISVKGEGALVSADKDALRQIGVNLVTNAVKYSEGEIEVEVEGNEIRYMDRGPGVPPGSEERIFERFYRIDDSLTRRENGSGLGLSIARALARGMGGDIRYAHRPCGGSVFTLTLALADNGNGETGK